MEAIIAALPPDVQDAVRAYLTSALASGDLPSNLNITGADGGVDIGSLLGPLLGALGGGIDFGVPGDGQGGAGVGGGGADADLFASLPPELHHLAVNVTAALVDAVVGAAGDEQVAAQVARCAAAGLGALPRSLSDMFMLYIGTKG